jgi:SAM-dependent methyltransferase
MAVMSAARSYTSSSEQSSGVLFEFANLFKGTIRSARNIRQEVADLLTELRTAEALIQKHGGLTVRDLDILEIGVGQLPRQLAYFAMQNRAVGMDLDVVPQGLGVRDYVRLLKTNGPKRLLKTVARKMTGYDWLFHRELARQLQVRKVSRPRTLQMDASRMEFPDGSFDLVYSFNVFEHLPDPAVVLQEKIRVTRPGGCVLTHFHLYSSDSGGHDVRILAGERQGMPYWPHLRPQHAALVRNAAYINRWRLNQWHQLFDRVTPGCAYSYWTDKDMERKKHVLKDLRQQGELADYTDQELLTLNLVSVWKKPTHQSAPA